MLPLRVAILWHQHQPYYKKNDEFILPWVRLHGVKDYRDLPALLREYPAVKQTFNLVPSLLLQVQDYLRGNARDAVERYTLLPAEHLSTEQKQYILDNFFLCNTSRMVEPYSRYNELYEHMQNGTALQSFTAQDWRDLQTWYNLTWIGALSRQHDDAQYLFAKGRDFTEEEKCSVLSMHRRILAQVLPVLQAMSDSGQVELSVTPAFHPILPLLCNAESASVAMPDAPMPAKPFRYPQDAREHVQRGVEIFRNAIGSTPVGMWPAEGSVSTEALSLLADAGLQWAASDEHVLAQTLGENYTPLDKYFPYTFRSAEGREIAMLFRDHVLSDVIGFVYSSWQATAAAADFCARLTAIRTQLVQEYGEEVLRTAVVPVILDGENCWEYYEGNGEPFLRALFQLLSSTPELATVTCSEAVAVERRATLEHMHPGSWINANFGIWIGNDEDNRAWDLLAQAREDVEGARPVLDADAYRAALDMLYIAEGSDWFWWYGDANTSANDAEFDSLFRWYIEQAYRCAALDVPTAVYTPIASAVARLAVVPPSRVIVPAIRGIAADTGGWEGAGYVDAALAGGAMHHAVDVLTRLWFGSGNGMVYFRCDIRRPLREGESIELECTAPRALRIRCSPHSLSVYTEDSLRFQLGAVALDEVLELAFPCSMLFTEREWARPVVQMRVRVTSQHGVQLYPASGVVALPLTPNDEPKSAVGQS